MSSLTRRLVPIFAMIVVLFTATSVYADTFSFSYSGSLGVAASGTFTTNPLSGGSFLITGITGTQNGLSMTLLAPSTFQFNDNLLFPTEPFLDAGGISFTAGGTNYNLFGGLPPGTCAGTLSSPCYTLEFISGAGLLTGRAITSFSVSSVSSVPEPSTLVLFVSGLVGLAGALRRKRLA